MKTSDEIIKQLKKRLEAFDNKLSVRNTGVVEKNTDGVIITSGLSNAQMGEQVEFENKSQGVVLNLDEDTVSVIVLGESENIKQGDSVKTTGKLLSINASEELLSRVINPLGYPLDGKTKIEKGILMPLEKIAAGFAGVKEAYALQAGRELRVIVKPDEITDDEAIVTAEKIKEELEQKFEVFPGQIKVTVIRETRAETTTKI